MHAQLQNAAPHADCEVAYFTNANHWLYLEEPDAFNEVVTRFLLQEGQDSLPPGVSRTRR